MRSVRDIQGSRPAGLQWATAKLVATKPPFRIVGARPLATKFGDKIEFWCESLDGAEKWGLLLSTTSVRQTYVDYFATPDAEPVGPCTLVWAEKYWAFLDVEIAVETPAEEPIPF